MGSIRRRDRANRGQANKGQAWAAVLLIIVIIAAAIYFLPRLPFIPTPPTIKYKNDIISVEEYYVSSLNPYEGSATTISFLVQNNGDKTVPYVVVHFFDIYGFRPIELKCQGEDEAEVKERLYPPDPQLKPNPYCVFSGDNAIESLDVREISLTLKAPEIEGAEEKSYKISYHIRYDHSGYRVANIPIIDGKTRKRPVAKFSQSEPSYGPIQMEFKPGEPHERIENGETIKEYWAVQQTPIEVEMSFKDIVGKMKEPNITEKDVKLNLGNAMVYGKVDEKPLPCDFCNGTEEVDNFLENKIACPNEDSGEPNEIYSKKNVLVPAKLICNLQSKRAITQPEFIASIEAEFNYTYKFIRTETFTVRPVEE